MDQKTHQDPGCQPDMVSAHDALPMIWTNVRNSPLTTRDLEHMTEVARLLEDLPTLPEFSGLTEQQVVLGALLYTRSMTHKYAAIIRDLLPPGTFVLGGTLSEQPAS